MTASMVTETPAMSPIHITIDEAEALEAVDIAFSPTVQVGLNHRLFFH